MGSWGHPELSFEIHPRIEHGIGDIGDEGDDQHHYADGQGDSLDDRVVAIEHGADDQLAETGNGEDGFGDGGPAYQEGKVNAEDGDR